MSAASPFHLVLDDFSLDPTLRPDLERSYVAEAFLRGADAFQVWDLLRALRQRSAPSAPSANRPSFGLSAPLVFDSEFAYLANAETMVHAAKSDYVQRLQTEFDGLSKDVQEAFAFENTAPFDYYQRIRPVYYNAGYDDPAKTIFRRIVPGSLLGKPIGGGIHEEFAAKMPQLQSKLNEWAPGLAVQVASEIRSVGGFVPRYIAPKKGEKKTQLSNHAFGLAVDIDANTNPQFKEKDDIEAINWVVRSLGYDYGKRFLEKPAGIGEMDWFAQTHLLAEQASDMVKKWAQKYLPTYVEVFTREQLEGQHTGKKHNAPLTHKEADKAISTMSALTGQPGQSKVLDATTQENLDRMRTLHKYHGYPKFDVLMSWSKRGIQSIPLYLAAAFGKLGFRWGQTYEKSKDAMHFELLHENLFPPEHRPRSLEELFPTAAQGPAQALKKVKVQKRKKAGA